MRNAYQASTACQLAAVCCCPNNPTGRAQRGRTDSTQPCFVPAEWEQSADGFLIRIMELICVGGGRKWAFENVKLHFLIPKNRLLFGCKSPKVFFFLG